MNQIDIKRISYDKWFKIGIIAIVVGIVSPFIFLVVKGIAGLIAAGVLGLVAVNFAPVLSMKLANWKVKGIVHEATVSPIETLTNLLLEKREAFRKFTEAVINQVSSLKTFERKSNEFAKTYPARAGEFQAQVEAMRTMVEKQQQALEAAKEAIYQGEQKLTEMSAYWEMSQIAQAANKTANMNTGDQFEQLKMDTSYNSVFDSVNLAFAQMEVAARLETPALGMSQPNMVISNIINVNAKVKV